MLAEGILQYLGVKGKFRRRQRHINWLCPGQDRVRAVILVKRREDNDLVPGFVTVIMAVIIASVLPQVTTISLLGSIVRPI